jgi:leader peptidase (prepilin peptidase)/N-methyltransferase
MGLAASLWPVILAPFIGSFLGVVVTRAEEPRALLFGRSACETCGTRLGAADLIPVASWVLLRGRCRACGDHIGLFHPLIEVAALVVALWPAFLFSGPLLWVSCFFGWTLLALAATDLKFYLLPDFLTLPLIPAGLLAAWSFEPSSLPAHLIGVAAGFFMVVSLRFAYRAMRGREGMGVGDAKLLAAAGAWLGWAALPSVIVLGSLTGLVFALWGKTRGDTLSLTNPVPFGAFLCLGTWVVWLYGPLTIG